MSQTRTSTDQPPHWVVVISITDPVTGAQITSKQHKCRDVLHARTMLTEIRELVEDLSEFLPGLSAEGYEIGDAFSLTSEGQSALQTLAEASAAGHVHNARWWSDAIGNVK